MMEQEEGVGGWTEDQVAGLAKGLLRHSSPLVMPDTAGTKLMIAHRKVP